MWVTQAYLRELECAHIYGADSVYNNEKFHYNYAVE